MKKKYTFIDLFAGCGGLSEGFLQTKCFEGLAHVEWEYPMVKTLRNRLVKKWNISESESKKTVVCFDLQRTDELINGGWESDCKYSKKNDPSVSKYGLNGIVNGKKVDLIIGGPPCQAYSIHGRATDKNSMKNDYRNFLFESFVKIVDSFKPSVFLFENVTGMLSAKPDGVNVTNRIFEAFKNIGYTIKDPNELSNSVFDAVDYGVPQFRKRVLIFGVRKDSDMNLNDIYDTLRFMASKKQKTVKDSIGFLPPIYPLEKSYKNMGKNISHQLLEGEKNVELHLPRYHNSRDILVFKSWVEKKMNSMSNADKIEFYKKTTKKDSLYVKYRNLEWDRPSFTVVAHLNKDGLMFIHPDSSQSRSITVREAGILMSFPLDFDFIGSMGDMYKMIGNAVPVSLANKIALSLYKNMEKLK